MTLPEAITARHSVRAYTDQPITGSTLEALERKIEEVNRRDGNLHVQLILDEPKSFLCPMAKYGKFRGMRNYLVMSGKKADDLDEDEKIACYTRMDLGIAKLHFGIGAGKENFEWT